MEPNYERVSGHFLRGVLRKAFPGGLTNIFVVLGAQAFMAAFDLPQAQISTVCAAIVGVVGLLVLFQTCKPFDVFRKIIWAAMALALVVSFTWLGSFFELRASLDSVQLVMATLLIMTPTVFFAMQRLFDWGDRIYLKIRSWIKKK
jgi:cation-transporting ATPase E